MRVLAGVTVLVLGLAACAKTQAPVKQMADARAAIRAAGEVGIEEVPEARLRHKIANERVAAAERLIEEGDHAEAALELERAEADAELAIALARLKVKREDAAEAQVRLRELRKTASSDLERPAVP